MAVGAPAHRHDAELAPFAQDAGDAFLVGQAVEADPGLHAIGMDPGGFGSVGFSHFHFIRRAQQTERPAPLRVRLQVRLEAFTLFNSPQYDERGYGTDTATADFGRINRNTTAQSNFQRFIQLGFRFIF